MDFVYFFSLKYRIFVIIDYVIFKFKTNLVFFLVVNSSYFRLEFTNQQQPDPGNSTLCHARFGWAQRAS